MLRFRTTVHGILGKCKYPGKLARTKNRSITTDVLKVVESPDLLRRSPASKVAIRASVIIEWVVMIIRLSKSCGVCSPGCLSVSLPDPLSDLGIILERRLVILTVEPRFGMRDRETA